MNRPTFFSKRGLDSSYERVRRKITEWGERVTTHVRRLSRQATKSKTKFNLDFSLWKKAFALQPPTACGHPSPERVLKCKLRAVGDL